MKKITKATLDISHNINSIGHTVVHKVDLKDNLTLLGSTFKPSHFDLDDEIINGFKLKTSQAIDCLKYLRKNIHRLANSYWPRLFLRNKSVAELFLQLIGPMTYKGIEEYYTDFDRESALLETLAIHPKEKETINESVSVTLQNYLSSLETVKYEVELKWKKLDVSSKAQLNEMIGQLNGILQLIKKRKVIQVRISNSKHKLDKLEGKDMALETISVELAEHNEDFANISHKLKSLLPQVFALLEEFVDDMTKLVLCLHQESFEIVRRELKQYVSFEGLHAESYEDVADQWETSMVEPTAKLEDFLGETTPKKDLFSFSLKFKDRKFKGKQKMMFDDSSDPLVEMVKFIDPEMFPLEVELVVREHYPEKIPMKDTIAVNVAPQNEVSSADITQTSTPPITPTDFAVTAPRTPAPPPSREAPPLPARDVPPLPERIGIALPDLTLPVLNFDLPGLNTILTNITLPGISLNGIILPVNSSFPPLPPRENSTLNNPHTYPNSPSSLPPLPARSKPLPLISANQVRTPLPRTPLQTSYEDIESSASETSSIISDISLDSDVMRNSTPDYVNEKIKIMYNSSKNDIRNAPIPHESSKYDIHLTNMETASSATYKLQRFNQFFEHVVGSVTEDSDTKMAVAKHTFKGTEVGDLSFNKGDPLEILLDFQKVSSLYVNGNNWLVGATEGGRIGFIPSNYVEVMSDDTSV